MAALRLRLGLGPAVTASGPPPADPVDVAVLASAIFIRPANTQVSAAVLAAAIFIKPQ